LPALARRRESARLSRTSPSPARAFGEACGSRDTECNESFLRDECDVATHVRDECMDDFSACLELACDVF
jgi:hypothetical protein